MDMVILPPSGVFKDTLDSFFAAQDSEKSVLWVQFLQSIGKDPNTQLTQADLQNETLQKEFFAYVGNVLLDLQTQQINLQSPDEIKKRTIMFTTFQVLLEMLATLQDTIGVIGHNLIFYGKWQEAYTKMLTKVPTYVGGTQSQPKVPTTVNLASLDRFTFGYGDISVSDIANWAADKLQGTGISTLKMTLNTDTLSTLRISLNELDSLDGQTNGTLVNNIMSQITTNDFIQVQVNADTKQVSFSIAGVDLTKLAGTDGVFFNTQPASAGEGSNFSIHVEQNVINTTTVSLGDGNQSGSTRTLTVPIGGVFMQGGYVKVTNPGSVQYAVTAPAATTTGTITDTSNTDSVVNTIKNTFLNFWKDPSTAALSQGGNITQIRMPIQRTWVYAGGNNAPPTFLGSIQLAPTSQLWFSDYTLDGSNPLDIIKADIPPLTLGLPTIVGVGDFHSVQVPGPIGNTLPSIPWTRTFVSNSTEDPAKTDASNASKARAEVNAKLQQFLENTRARRQVVQDTAQQVQSNLSQAKDSVSQQANILNSILDSLKSIIGGIFR